MSWIFGLSIDEGIRWAATYIDPSNSYTVDQQLSTCGTICDSKELDIQNDLQSFLSKKMGIVRDDNKELFRRVSFIGISTAGVINKRSLRLLRIDRKIWSDQGRGYLVDFRELMQTYFPHKNLTISIENDATAKCLAEHYIQHDYYQAYRTLDRFPVASLFYASFNDGVNGGFARDDELGNSIINLEMGHIFPPLHPDDKIAPASKFLESFSGCKEHGYCFVGLAGARRIKNQWNESLEQLNLHEDRQWKFISYYIAHFCWYAVLVLSPQRILLGGAVIYRDLIPHVQAAFDQLNAFHKGSYIDYPDLKKPGFIAMAVLQEEIAGVAGAIELARRTHISKKPEQPPAN